MMKQLGNYRIVHQIIWGGFGSAYLGEHIHFGTQAFIKVWTARTRQEAEQLLAEAHIIARLNHPNIIRVLDFGVDDDNTAFFVTTYALNGTLREHYRRGVPYPVTTILPHVKQAAAALQYVHDQGIVHCDVKPSNFLLGENNEILLCDFGSAVVLKNPSTSEKLEMRVFSPGYVAPEQLRGEVSLASDQYALGIIVYEWLCGEGPFDENNDVSKILFHHVQTSPPSLRSKVPTISPRVEQVVLRALSKDPQQRFPRIQDFADALEKASIPPKSIEIFFSYSHNDEMMRDELAKRLAHLKQQGLITEWYDREIEAGRDWADEVDSHLKTADIILLLVSPDFLASDYCYNIEMMRALKRHETGDAIVIPVILRPTSWKETPLGKLQALPKEGKAIMTWQNQDEAFLDVAEGIQKVIQRLANRYLTNR